MNAIVKMQRAYHCLENFRNNCGNDEHKKLVDIFFPMLYQKNKHHLEISVGKKVDEYGFVSWLHSDTDSYVVKLSQWENEPQLIFGDRKRTIALINLALVDRLHIVEEKEDGVGFYQYQIYFRYGNEVDYRIKVAIEE